MKKQEEIQQKYDIDDFEQYVHLWNMVPAGRGKGLVLLRKIVDCLQNNNYSNPVANLPSFLITGATGKSLAGKALVNSLALTDIRECPAKFLESGITSYQHFANSSLNTAHIIKDVEDIHAKAESTLWKFLKHRQCNYYNPQSRECDNVVHRNGLIVMTTQNEDAVPDLIKQSTDYIVEVEPMNSDQLEAVIHQRLVFAQVDYDGDPVLRSIIKWSGPGIDTIIPFLNKCVMLMKAEMKEVLTVHLVERTKTMICRPLPPSPIDY